MASFARRRRLFDRGIVRETARDDMDAHEVSSDRSSDSRSDSGSDSDLESMTAQGIKHLCSELLELKKASDRDFHRNIYSNYPIFISVFQQIGSLERDIGDLKKQVSTHSKLVQDLTNCNRLHFDSLFDTLIKDEEAEESITTPTTNHEIYVITDDTLDILDILLYEHRTEEAIAFLENQNQSLHKIQETENPSFIGTLSVYRTRIIDQLSILAENPRVSEPELKKTLFYLCKLGVTHRANYLLIKFYRSRLVNYTEELHHVKSFPYVNYMKEFARIVFSTISQALTSFTQLYGDDSSPYFSELIKWARDETMSFSLSFYEYIKSAPETSEYFILSVEAVNFACLYCSMLGLRGIFLKLDLIELIRPCMEHVLHMHVRRLKKVVGLFVEADTWILGKFLIARIVNIKEKESLKEVESRLEYCLLTTSGRKFVTLLQELVDETSLLVEFEMGSSVEAVLAELFNEYMAHLESTIINNIIISNTQGSLTLHQKYTTSQLSILVNCSTLLALIPVIATTVIFKGTLSMDVLVKSSKEAVDRVWVCFCHQFVCDLMSIPGSEFASKFIIPDSPEYVMPSFRFQELFLRMGEIEYFCETIFSGDYGTSKKLLTDIMEHIILHLSDNLDFWRKENHFVIQNHSFSDLVT